MFVRGPDRLLINVKNCYVTFQRKSEKKTANQCIKGQIRQQKEIYTGTLNIL